MSSARGILKKPKAKFRSEERADVFFRKHGVKLAVEESAEVIVDIETSLPMEKKCKAGSLTNIEGLNLIVSEK